jgi:hypothetical protein
VRGDTLAERGARGRTATGEQRDPGVGRVVAARSEQADDALQPGHFSRVDAGAPLHSSSNTGPTTLAWKVGVFIRSTYYRSVYSR